MANFFDIVVNNFYNDCAMIYHYFFIFSQGVAIGLGYIRLSAFIVHSLNVV